MSHLRRLTALLALFLGQPWALVAAAKPTIAAFERIPVSFVQNLGQADANVDFLAHRNGATVSLSSGKMRIEFEAAAPGFAREAIDLGLVGANSHPRAEGIDPVATKSNYFVGSESARWIAGIPHYSRVRYREVYPGIDLVYYGSGPQLEYDFIVHPYADPSRIRLKIQGASKVRVEQSGALLVQSAGGQAVRHLKPRIYQQGSADVQGNYVLVGKDEVQFRLAHYDRARTLVIDPTLNYGTFLVSNTGIGIAVDSTGSAYVLGALTVGLFVRVQVTKINPSGTAIEFTAIFGGSGNETPVAMALDGQNNIYISGITASQNFPVTAGAYRTTSDLLQDAFVTKLNSTGSTLLYSTYLGGTSREYATGVGADASGAIYVAGYTSSTDFPAVNALDPVFVNPFLNNKGFVAKLNPNLSGTASLVYSTYFGAPNGSNINGLAVSPAGLVHITGYCGSGCPVTSGAYQSTPQGNAEAFFAQLNPSIAGAGSLLYSTYIGGSGDDLGIAVKVDGQGYAYVAGTTSGAFPITSGALQIGRGLDDVFVAKFNPAASGAASLLYSARFGGDGFDKAAGIALNAAGNAYVTGFTSSFNFPAVGASFQGPLTQSGYSDAFVAKLNAAGSALIYSTNLGGEFSDEARAIALDSNGAAYITGITFSHNFPTTPGVVQQQWPPDVIGQPPYVALSFVAKITDADAVCSYSISPTNTSISGLEQTGSVQVTAPSNCSWNAAANVNWLGVNSGTAGTGNGTVIYGAASNGPNPRTGTLTIAGQTFTVSQQGTACSYVVSPLSVTIGSAADRVIINVSTAPACPWTVTSNASWLLAAPFTLIGSQSANIAVAPQTGQQRVGTLTIAGQTVTVTQTALSQTTGARFVPVTPCRVADTRLAPGPFGAPSMTAGQSRSFPIPQSSCGIPSTAVAYSLNVTVVPQGPLAFLTAWPTGQQQPVVSTLNSFDGRIKANAAIVPAGTNGAVSIYVTNPTDVVLDINGYFVAASGNSNLAFYPMTPCRIVDTRRPVGAYGGPSLAAGQTRSFYILNSDCGIPSAAAYSLNFTVVPSGPLAFLTTWPATQPQPLVSTLNALTGTVTANSAIVPTWGGGINVYVTHQTDVIIDINGFFAPPGGVGELAFYPVTPCRISDTRNPAGPFGGPAMQAGQTRDYAVPASGCGLPSTAKAYSLNATVLPSGILGFLTLWGSGQIQPFVSTLNSFDGSVVSNAAIAPAGTTGSVAAYVSHATELILDVNGYFGP